MVGDREEARRGCGLGRNSRLRAHNVTHLSGFPNFSKFRWNAIMLPWPTHPTETTLGVLFDIFPEFLTTEKGLPLVDAWSRGLDKIHMYPDGDAKNQAVVSQEVALTSVDGFFFSILTDDSLILELLTVET